MIHLTSNLASEREKVFQPPLINVFRVIRVIKLINFIGKRKRLIEFRMSSRISTNPDVVFNTQF